MKITEIRTIAKGQNIKSGPDEKAGFDMSDTA